MENVTDKVFSGIIALMVGACFLKFRSKILNYIEGIHMQSNNEGLTADRVKFIKIFVLVFGIAAIVIGLTIIYQTILRQYGG